VLDGISWAALPVRPLMPSPRHSVGAKPAAPPLGPARISPAPDKRGIVAIDLSLLWVSIDHLALRRLQDSFGQGDVEVDGIPKTYPSRRRLAPLEPASHGRTRHRPAAAPGGAGLSARAAHSFNGLPKVRRPASWTCWPRPRRYGVAHHSWAPARHGTFMGISQPLLESLWAEA